jgi:ribonuclease P protein component
MLATLKRRSEFLRVRGGARWATSGFVLEAKPRVDDTAADGPRFGFTVTKQMGNAVVRNRIRRRLREAIRLSVDSQAHSGNDYVLIARSAALDRPFGELVRDLQTAFERVHRPARGTSREATR